MSLFQTSEVLARIEEKVPALFGRMGLAGKFATLVEGGKLPQQTPAGFVLPGGLKGGSADAGAGIFRQHIAKGVIVVLCVRFAGDALGDRGADIVDPLAEAVVKGLVGWGPETAPGVFVLEAGELVGSDRGTLIYQLDFSLNDQLRVKP